MKRTALLFLAIMLTATASLAQVPRGVIAEDGTATWCVYCPDAYAGLEVMKSRYDATEFTAIRYYSSSQGGGLSTTETDGRNSYYGVNSFPTVVFDGLTKVIGGSSDIAAGNGYEPVVATEIGKPSPLKITINSVVLSGTTGSIDCNIEVVEAIPDISQMKVRMTLVENNVTYGTDLLTDVVRDLLPDAALTVSQVGEVQNVVQSIPIDPSWKTGDLWVAVFVQNDNGKAMIQATSTRSMPDYSLRYWTRGPNGVLRPANSGVYEFPDCAAYNMGAKTDTFHVALQAGALPPGWSCVFTDGTNDYDVSTDIPLDPGQGQILRLKVTVGDPGYILPKIVLTSPNLPGRTREIPFVVVSDGLQALIVDDDGVESYEQMHATALAAAGVSYAIWPTTVADMSAPILAAFPLVDWEIGLSYPTLTTTDRAALSTYLDGGGRLFISGQDLGWEMNDNGGASLTWYHNYLHANFVLDNAAQNALRGVPGDPISDGMTLNLTAALNPYPDAITPRDAWGTHIFFYGATSGTRKGAIAVATGVYKLVYLGFGYETISSENNRKLLMQRVVDWLLSTTDAPGHVAALPGARISAVPNPAHGGAELHFVLPQAGAAEIELYGPDGALVRRLTQPSRPAGAYTLRWDGRDNDGTPAASGVYFYRLRAGSARPTGKLVLTK